VSAGSGVRVEIRQLDYNLLTLKAGLQGVTVTAARSSIPFFHAEAIVLDLPWAIVRGTRVIDALEIRSPRLLMVREADGTSNLPDTRRAESEGSIGPIHFGRLVVNDLDARYEDRAHDISVYGRGVSLDMRRHDGSLLIGRLPTSADVSIRAGRRQTRISRVDGQLGFDGTAITLDPLVVELPEGRLRLSGAIDVLTDRGFEGLQFQGDLDLEQLSSWTSTASPARGRVAFSGGVAGALDAPLATIELAGDRVSWSGIDASVRGRARLSAESGEVVSFTARLAGGEIGGEARIPFDQVSDGRARLDWRNIDVRRIAPAASETSARLASVADGAATLNWRGSRVLTGRGSMKNILRPERRADGLAVSGRSELRLEGGRYELAHEHWLGNTAVLRGSARGRLDLRDLPASTLNGDAALRIRDLPSFLRELSEAGVATGISALPDLQADIAADAELLGTLAAPNARGTLEATQLRYGETPPGSARARFRASPASVDIDGLLLTVGPNTIEGEAAIDLEARTVRGRLAAALPQLSDLTRAIPVRWRPNGSASAKAGFSGSIDAPIVEVDLTSPDLRVADQQVESLHSTVRIARGIVTVDRLEFAQNGGRLAAGGRYALASGRYAFEISGHALSIVPSEKAELPLDALFDLQLRGGGTLAAPEAEGFVDVARLSWDGYELGPAHVTLRTDRGTLHVSGRIPEAAAALRAQMAVSAPRAFTADLTLADASLPRLTRRTGPAGTPVDGREPPFERAALTGDITLGLHASGDLEKLDQTVAELDLRLDDVTLNAARVRLERPARLRFSGGGLAVDDFALTIGGTSVSALGRLGGGSDSAPLRVEVAGSLSDLVPLLRIAPGLEALDASGRVDFQASAAGALTAPALDAELSLSSGRVAWGTLPPLSDIELRTVFSDGILDVRDLRAVWQDAVLAASAQVPIGLLGDRLPAGYRRSLPEATGPARATARIASLTQAALSPFLDPESASQIAGRFDVVATATAQSLAVEDIQADVTLERAEVELARVPLHQVGPTRLRFERGRLEVVEWSWAGAGNRIDVAGGARLGVRPPELDLALKGAVDLRMLSAFAPGVASSGRATFDVKVTGTAADPSVDGQISVENGGVILRDPRIAVTDLQGIVAFARDEIQLRDFTAHANGGTVRITGTLRYPRLELEGGALSIAARGLALELPEHLRSEVDADLQLNLSRDAPSLTGTVTVLRGSYREPISLTVQLFAGVETSAIAPAAGEPGFADRLALGIAVRTAERIAVDNNYGRFDITGNLRVVGTAEKPVPTGRLTIEEGGDVYLGGRTYEVVRGSIDFTSGARIEPEIDLALETRVQRYDITLEVTGTPQTIEASLRSPGLSQADVISLLLTGQIGDERAMVDTEVARSQLLMLLSGEILGFAGRAVGLDAVQISRGLGGAASDFDLLATDTDPSARLTIRKHVSRSVELVFSQSLSETGDITWIALYRPGGNVEIRAATQDDGSRSYELRHEVDFGGAEGSRPRAEQAATAAERVAAVRILGSPGFEEREIRDRLRLNEGDRFDFYRWQRDRDRLESFYHGREFFEARISARRAPAGDAIALEYEITRGPRTTLTVEGLTLPDDLVSRLETAWASAVFDGFLLEDLAAMVQAHLTSTGYLRADVSAAVVSDPAAAIKEIVVRVAPGTRFADRRLTFVGPQRFDAPVLEAAVQAADLGASIWRDPTPLEAAIERHYGLQGYLEAEVDAGPAVFAGQTATLPVRISEGRQFTIAEIEVRGARGKSEADVRRAFAVTPASAYVPGDLEPARRAVELEYRRAGYNDVRVSVAARINEKRGHVDVLLDVEEGRQHVLADIAITGGGITNPGLVRRALALRPGEPVSLSDIYRAEKRLYDTGVFRAADIAFVPLEREGPDTVQPVRASVSLLERSPYRFRYGFRLNDAPGPAEVGREARPALVIDLLRRNLFGRGISTGVAGQLESDRRLARGFVALPGLFGLPVTTNFFLTASREDFTPEGATPFVEDESSITAEQRFTPSPRTAVTYGYNFSRTHVFEPEPIPGIPPLELQAKIGRLTGTYAWDRRDDPVDAQDGWFHSSGVELGAAALGSDLRFIKYLAQLHHLKSVRRGVVLGSAFRLGMGRGFDQDLIPSERFFAGGGTSVRGFAEDSLGELDFLGEPRGGNAMMLFNQELRFPVFGWARGVAFFDAGTVFPRIADLSLSDLAAGAGIGVRIHSPFALVRIDFGIPLTNRQREPSGRWYFGLGQVF
jgi:outer membrane protein assembly complex protein YaeT